MELSLGQFTSEGALTLWKFTPIFVGIGVGWMCICFFLATYFNVIIGWAIWYFVHSFRSVLPWNHCGHWASDLCNLKILTCNESDGFITYRNGTCYNQTSGRLYGVTNLTLAAKHGIISQESAFDYMRYVSLKVSSGIHDVGMIRWEMILCFLLGWFLTFIFVFTGVKTSGRVAYFTAVLPYFLLLAFLINGLLQEGCEKGLLYFFDPRVEDLKDIRVWRDAAFQLFYSLGICWGGLATLGSHNRFTNNVVRDTFIITLCNFLTCILTGLVVFAYLGSYAHARGINVADVMGGGIALIFVVYPQAVTTLPFPPLWSILFFLMIILLAVDTQFAIIETILYGIIDPIFKLRPYKTYIILGICILCFMLGLIMATPGGVYILTLIDDYCGWILMILLLLECFAVAIYGIRRFSLDIETMVGRRVMKMNWRILRWCFIISWVFFSPICALGCLILSCLFYKPSVYHNYIFPPSANIIGWCLTVIVLLMVLAAMIFYLIRAKGSCTQRFRKAYNSSIHWGPALRQNRELITYIPGFTVDPNNDTVKMRRGIYMNKKGVMLIEKTSDTKEVIVDEEKNERYKKVTCKDEKEKETQIPETRIITPTKKDKKKSCVCCKCRGNCRRSRRKSSVKENEKDAAETSDKDIIIKDSEKEVKEPDPVIVKNDSYLVRTCPNIVHGPEPTFIIRGSYHEPKKNDDKEMENDDIVKQDDVSVKSGPVATHSSADTKVLTATSSLLPNDDNSSESGKKNACCCLGSPQPSRKKGAIEPKKKNVVVTHEIEKEKDNDVIVIKKDDAYLVKRSPRVEQNPEREVKTDPIMKYESPVVITSTQPTREPEKIEKDPIVVSSAKSRRKPKKVEVIKKDPVVITEAPIEISNPKPVIYAEPVVIASDYEPTKIEKNGIGKEGKGDLTVNRDDNLTIVHPVVTETVEPVVISTTEIRPNKKENISKKKRKDSKLVEKTDDNLAIAHPVVIHTLTPVVIPVTENQPQMHEEEISSNQVVYVNPEVTDTKTTAPMIISTTNDEPRKKSELDKPLENNDSIAIAYPETTYSYPAETIIIPENESMSYMYTADPVTIPLQCSQPQQDFSAEPTGSKRRPLSGSDQRRPISSSIYPKREEPRHPTEKRRHPTDETRSIQRIRSNRSTGARPIRRSETERRPLYGDRGVENSSYRLSRGNERESSLNSHLRSSSENRQVCIWNYQNRFSDNKQPLNLSQSSLTKERGADSVRPKNKNRV